MLKVSSLTSNHSLEVFSSFVRTNIFHHCIWAGGSSQTTVSNICFFFLWILIYLRSGTIKLEAPSDCYLEWTSGLNLEEGVQVSFFLFGRSPAISLDSHNALTRGHRSRITLMFLLSRDFLSVPTGRRLHCCVTTPHPILM